MIGPTRLATGAPPASSRLIGLASGESILRGPDDGAALAAGASAPLPPHGDGDDPVSTSRSSDVTNSPSSLALTSASTPRPIWATSPVMVRSVSTVTLVPAPAGTSVAVIVADALPCPRVSRPSALSTAVWLDASRDTNVAAPLY